MKLPGFLSKGVTNELSTETVRGDFPGGPVVPTPCFYCWRMEEHGFNPWLAACHTALPKEKTKEERARNRRQATSKGFIGVHSFNRPDSPGGGLLPPPSSFARWVNSGTERPSR